MYIQADFLNFDFIMFKLLWILLTCAFGGLNSDHCLELTYKSISKQCLKANKPACERPPNIRHNVTNNTLGEIDFQLVNFCANVGKHFIKLLVDQHTCNISHASLHTQLEYDVTDEASSKACPDPFDVKFAYVFTGCYFLSIETNGLTWNSPPLYIETDYKRQPIKDSDLKISSRETSDSELEFAVQVESKFLYGPPKITALVAKTEEIVRTNLYGSVQVCNFVTNKTCFFTKTHYKCVFYTTEPGNYSFLFHLSEHAQCNPSSLWEFECIWSHNFDTTNKHGHMSSDATLREKYADNIQVFALYVFVTVLIASLCTVLYMSFTRSLRNKPTTSENNPLLTENDPPTEILLIYFKESNEFAEIIDCLKDVLKSRTVTVKELYEYDEKAVNPQKWLETKIADKHVRIVVILNKTGAKLTEFSPGPIVGDLTSCFDELFLYAIDLLRLKARTYTNLFVAEMENYDRPPFLNTFTRYKLPEHTDVLLRDLNVNVQEKTTIVQHFQTTCLHYINSNDNV